MTKDMVACQVEHFVLSSRNQLLRICASLREGRMEEVDRLSSILTHSGSVSVISNLVSTSQSSKIELMNFVKASVAPVGKDSDVLKALIGVFVTTVGSAVSAQAAAPAVAAVGAGALLTVIGNLLVLVGIVLVAVSILAIAGSLVAWIKAKIDTAFAT